MDAVPRIPFISRASEVALCACLLHGVLRMVNVVMVDMSASETFPECDLQVEDT
jgi:hypothetical protein